MYLVSHKYLKKFHQHKWIYENEYYSATLSYFDVDECDLELVFVPKETYYPAILYSSKEKKFYFDFQTIFLCEDRTDSLQKLIFVVEQLELFCNEIRVLCEKDTQIIL